jgi:hypothetical protein
MGVFRPPDQEHVMPDEGKDLALVGAGNDGDEDTHETISEHGTDAGDGIIPCAFGSRKHVMQRPQREQSLCKACSLWYFLEHPRRPDPHVRVAGAGPFDSNGAT